MMNICRTFFGDIKQDVFRLVTSVGQRKNYEFLRGIEPQTFGAVTKSRTGTWDSGLGDVGLGDVGLGDTRGLGDVINKQHLTFALNL